VVCFGCIPKLFLMCMCALRMRQRWSCTEVEVIQKYGARSYKVSEEGIEDLFS